jgi:DNA-binding response OmpR family regulator
MEPMTGQELLMQVRADPGLGQIPFIMVTADANAANVLAAKKAGVNNFIVKPFNPVTMKAKIDAVFAGRTSLGGVHPTTTTSNAPAASVTPELSGVSVTEKPVVLLPETDQAQACDGVTTTA